MLVSIEEFLNENGIRSEETIYLEEPKEIRNYRMILGEFLTFEKRGKEQETFPVMQRIREKTEAEKAVDPPILLLKEMLRLANQLIEILRQPKPEQLQAQQSAIKEVRSMKKVIQDYYKSRIDEVEAHCMSKLLGEGKALQDKVLWYKKTAYLTTLKNLAFTVPALNDITENTLKERPLFAANLEEIQKAIKGNRPIAVEGGPCLFGYDEVEIKVVHKDGRTYYYDFAEPRYFECSTEGKLDFDTHIKSFADEIADITFIKKKQSLTRGDLQGILYVLEFANALNAKAVIPIVDMSYRKYMNKACEELPEKLKKKVEEDFQKVVYKISDVYLNWINVLKSRYPKAELLVVHERDEELCRKYYRGREAYLKNIKKVNAITDNKVKRDSILDYVTMPALPLYQWGIQNILQVDCISEVDAYRRCRKLHGKDLRLSAIFYPESISLDGQYSDYSARCINKDYVWLD